MASITGVVRDTPKEEESTSMTLAPVFQQQPDQSTPPEFGGTYTPKPTGGGSSYTEPIQSIPPEFGGTQIIPPPPVIGLGGGQDEPQPSTEEVTRSEQFAALRGRAREAGVSSHVQLVRENKRFANAEIIRKKRQIQEKRSIPREEVPEFFAPTPQTLATGKDLSVPKSEIPLQLSRVLEPPIPVDTSRFFPTEFLHGIQVSKDILRTKELRGKSLTTKEKGKRILLGVLEPTVRVFTFGEEVIRSPVTTTTTAAVGIVSFIQSIPSQPSRLGPALRQPFPSPSSLVGSIGGEVATGVVVGKAIDPAVKSLSFVVPKVRTLEVPQGAGKISRVDILGFETKKGRALVIGSRTEEGFGFGSPDIKRTLGGLPSGTEIKLATALETKVIKKSLATGGTERASSLIDISQDILRRTQRTPSKFIDKDLLTAPTERLPKKGVQVVLDIAKEEEGVLFGSKSRAFQLAQEFEIKGEKFKLDKIPRDIELRFDTLGEEGLKDVTEKTIGRFKKLGTIEEGGRKFELGTAREIKDTPFAIETKVDGEFMKSVELKGKGAVLEGEEVSEFVAGFRKTGKVKTLEGIKVTTLTEELRGVSQGVLRVRKTKGVLDIFPSPKRAKDIGSVVVSARTLEQSKPSVKLRSSIEKFEGLFPEGLVKQQVQRVVDEPVALADFRTDFGSPATRSFTSQVSGGVSRGIVISPIQRVGRTSEIRVVSKSPFRRVEKSFSVSPSSSRSISPSVSPKTISPSVSPSPKPSLKRISPSPRDTSPSFIFSPSHSFSGGSVSTSTSTSTSTSPIDIPFPIPSRTPFILPKPSGRRGRQRGFTVSLRRFGKFRPIGTTRTQAQAFEIGRTRAAKTLGATFKVEGTGVKQPRKIKGFRTKKTKKGTLFIEQPKFRLSKKTETQEIQSFKRRKR